jgi:hypothetical protein
VSIKLTGLDPQKHFINNTTISTHWPILVAARSKVGFAAALLLGLRVRIPPGAWMSLSSECCVLSGRGLCDRLITCSGESYRLWCVWVWSRSLGNGKAWPTRSVEPLEKKKNSTYLSLHSNVHRKLHNALNECFRLQNIETFPELILWERFL